MNYSELIFKNESLSLDSIPMHFQNPNVRRLAPQNFPLHTAIHCVSEIEPLAEAYVQPHQHDVPEINIFIPTSDSFEFEVQLGDSFHLIHEHCSIWIPQGLIHATNMKQGSGFFVCVILDATKNIDWKNSDS